MNLKRKDMEKRLDKLAQTVSKWKGAWYRDGKWWNKCITCGRIVPMEGKNAGQGGHFFPRGVKNLRWDKLNINCQDAYCNLYKNGAYIEYSKWFIETYGVDTFSEYMEKYESYKRGDFKGYKVGEVAEIYNYWLKKGRELEEKVGHQLFPKTWKYATM